MLRVHRRCKRDSQVPLLGHCGGPPRRRQILYTCYLQDTRKILIAYAWLKNYRSILKCAFCAFQTTKLTNLRYGYEMMLTAAGRCRRRAVVGRAGGGRGGAGTSSQLPARGK